MILKSLIRYTNSASLEATWVDEEGKPVKCRAYSGDQMDELRADLDSDAQQYEEMIAQCEVDWSNQ